MRASTDAFKSRCERTIDVFIVADVRLCRSSLAQLLTKRRCFGVVGVDSCRLEILADPRIEAADVILIDVRSTDSMEFIRAAYARTPKRKITAYAVPNLLDEIVSYAEAGASGYLIPEASSRDLFVVIERTVRGSFSYPPEVMAMIVRRLANASRPSSVGEASLLSPRETEVLDQIVQGRSNKEIASSLKIEVHTVKNHVHNILAKLHLRRRFEAARWSEARRPGSR